MKLTTTIERYTLISPLSPKEIVATLETQMCGPNDYQQEKVKKYTGTADDKSFNIRRLDSRPRNINKVGRSFNLIEGAITPHGSGSSIYIRMSAPVLLIFVVEIITVIGFPLFFFWDDLNFNENPFLYFLPLAMLPGMFGIVFLLAKMETKGSRTFLKDLFKEDVINK